MRWTPLHAAFLSLILACASPGVSAQSTLPVDLQERVGKISRETLAKTGVPSASVAVVKDGKIAFLAAYGEARLDPETPAKPGMRYSIGSISKQFTAAAILFLQEDGKLSLDEKVGRFVPGLTRGDEVTIREVLSHTSGYQDYWPQDYVMPGMLKPVTAQAILAEWAGKPLGFEPGTDWQYSNTNYVIAGLIVEKVSGMPLLEYLRTKIFAPLGMSSALNIDQELLGETDANGYLRYALGPLRPAPKEGKGWLFAAGELAMTAEDLAKWNISIINQTLLKPDSYRALETEVLLKNGLGTQYGLGVGIRSQFGHRAIAHGGEVSGFTASNLVFPDQGVAVTVLTNEDAARAAGAIARAIAPLLLVKEDPAAEEKLKQAWKIFEGLQKGAIDRSLFTDNANSYFSETALEDFAKSLGPLGAPTGFVQTDQGLRGGMRLRVYEVKTATKTLRAWTYELTDGKLEQYQVAAQD